MTNWLKVNTIDTSGTCQKKQQQQQQQHYNAKIKNIEDNIPSITNLATADALTAVENKIRYQTLVLLSEKKKKIMIQKYQKFRKNVSPYLIITNLQIIYLMER